jgi:hypothetical protein
VRHLDDVEGPGQFVEPEVGLRPGQPQAEGVAIASDLMSRSGISAGQPVDGTRVDLANQGP